MVLTKCDEDGVPYLVQSACFTNIPAMSNRCEDRKCGNGCWGGCLVSPEDVYYTEPVYGIACVPVDGPPFMIERQDLPDIAWELIEERIALPIPDPGNELVFSIANAWAESYDNWRTIQCL